MKQMIFNTSQSLVISTIIRCMLSAVSLFSFMACQESAEFFRANPDLQVVTTQTFNVYPQGKDTYNNDEVTYGFNADGQMILAKDRMRIINYSWEANKVAITQTSMATNDTTLEGMVIVDKQRLLPLSAILNVSDGTSTTYSFDYVWNNDTVLSALTVIQTGSSNRRMVFEFSGGFVSSPLTMDYLPVEFCPLFFEYRGQLGAALSRLLCLQLSKTIRRMPQNVLLMVEDEEGKSWSQLMEPSYLDANGFSYAISNVSMAIVRDENGSERTRLSSLNADQFVQYKITK